MRRIDQLLALYGRPAHYSDTVASTGAETLTLSVVVPTGKLWLVVYATARQTSGGDRVITWRREDLITPAAYLLHTASTGTGVYRGIYSPPTATFSYPLPWVCNGHWTLRADCVTVGAGENFFLDADVLELPLGVFD